MLTYRNELWSIVRFDPALHVFYIRRWVTWAEGWPPIGLTPYNSVIVDLRGVTLVCPD